MHGLCALSWPQSRSSSRPKNRCSAGNSFVMNDCESAQRTRHSQAAQAVVNLCGQQTFSGNADPTVFAVELVQSTSNVVRDLSLLRTMLVISHCSLNDSRRMSITQALNALITSEQCAQPIAPHCPMPIDYNLPQSSFSWSMQLGGA